MVMTAGLLWLLLMRLVARIGNARGDAAGVVQDQREGDHRAHFRQANWSSAPHPDLSLP
jgi:hypothetical protein